MYLASICRATQWYPSVHWVNQWYSSRIPVYTGPASELCSISSFSLQCSHVIDSDMRQVANILIDQSHRYGRHQAACRKPAGSYDKTTRTAICFEHKTQYLLIRAPYTRIVVFWHISNIPPMISQSQISCNTHTFYIAAIYVKYCYTTGSWLL